MAAESEAAALPPLLRKKSGQPPPQPPPPAVAAAAAASSRGPAAGGDGDTVKDVETATDHLITELESADGHVASTLRTVYQTGDHKHFLAKLQARIKAQDLEIEKMCHHHYQGFIDAVRELLQVRNQAETVKADIEATNDSLQLSGNALSSKAAELVRNRETQRNVCTVVEKLELCLPVLETYAKLQDQMANKRYYPALKTLEQLEHTYLPRVTHYRFTQQMCAAIPNIRDLIREASMSDLKDFLEGIRRQSGTVGEAAMKLAALQHGLDVNLAKKAPKKKAQQAPTAATTVLDKLMLGNQDTAEEEPQSAQDLVDFSPVYRCLHINSVLGTREQFESYYRKQRRQQCELLLTPPANMGESLEGYRTYFHNIVGFFVCEDHILNTTSGLVTRLYVDDVWEKQALPTIVSKLRSFLAYSTDADHSLQTKNLIVLFCHSMKGYGFAVSQLYELLLETRDNYMAILMQKWVQVFSDIFDKDDYTGVPAPDEEHYYFVVKTFPYVDEQFEKAPFPKRFPFSQMVTLVHEACKRFILECHKFCDGLNLSNTEVDDVLRDSANMLVTRTLSGCISKLLKKPDLRLLQVIQVAINMSYLEHSSDYLEDYITSVTGAEKDSTHTARLTGTAKFKDARNEAESLIYSQLNNKVDEFLGLASYEWTMSDARPHPSGYIVDLIAFLQSTFISFTNLPDKIAVTACMSACKHVASTLKDFLLDDSVKTITMGALHQFSKDVEACESFACSELVPGKNDGTLRLAFSELRQLVDLVITGDWSTYVAEYGTDRSKYGRVQPQAVVAVLEKLRGTSGKKGLLDTLKKKSAGSAAVADRDRQQLLDAVIKRVKALAP